MFNQYPYLNLNDFNLDYLLKAIKEMRYEVTNFVSINAIKYADPIQWVITRQYEKNTIVIDPITGTAYISVAPVPAGVALTRPEYWTVVFDLQSFVTKANQNLANNYEEQTTTTATMNTAAGDWVIWGDVLYKALVNITAGDAYVVGSNIQRVVIEDVIKAILQDIADEVQARQNADNTLQGNIDAEVLARQGADNTLQGNIDAEVLARQGADNTINGTIGDLNNLTTTNKTSIVNAINETVQRIDNINPIASWLDGKKIYVFGDSLSNLSSLGQDTMWDKLVELLPDLDITIDATPGITMSQINSRIASTSMSDADIIFIQGGTNDWTTNVSMATTYTQTKSAITNAIQNSNNGAQVVTIAPPFSYYDGFTDGFTNTKYSKISDYGTAIKMASNEFGVPCLDLYTLTSCNELNYTKKLHMSGGASYVHPNDDFCAEIAYLIIDQTYNNNCSPLRGKLENGTNGSASTALIGIDPDTGMILHTGTFVTSAAIAQNDNIGDLHCPVGTINSSIVHGVVNAPVVFNAYNQTAGELIRCRLNYTADSSSLQLISPNTIASGAQIMF